MPKRRRLGVALLVDPPAGIEIAGVRRALGDARLGSIPAHITLVPPVNVRSEDIPQAMAVLRDAASKVPGPIHLTLGPPRSFMPDNPVAYLGVGGEPTAVKKLGALREALLRPPFWRELSWPWVPHVTILDSAQPEKIDAALGVLNSYSCQVSFERAVILELDSNRRWVPLSDVIFGPYVRVGTGGLPVELSYSRLPDAELAAALGGDENLDATAGSLVPAVFLTARREGSLAGAAGAWVDRSGPVVVVWVREGMRRQGVGATLLAHLELRLRREGWNFARLAGRGPAGFFERCSAWSVSSQR